MTLSQAQCDILTSLSIFLKPVTLPAFGKKSSYWTYYKELECDNIRSVSVKTQITGEVLGSYYYLHVNCYFEDGKNVQEKYGLVYGDDQFEDNISAHIQSLLGVSTQEKMIGYTESGMQEVGYISLEGNQKLIREIASLSKHRLLKIIESGMVQSIKYGDLSWAES